MNPNIDNFLTAIRGLLPDTGATRIAWMVAKGTIKEMATEWDDLLKRVDDLEDQVDALMKAHQQAQEE